MDPVPAIRIHAVNDKSVNPEGGYVLYWMVAQRRLTWNFALERAVEHARELRKPLVVFEPLRCGYRWASDRLHRFVLQGMSDNERRLGRAGVLYYPYVEPEAGAGKGLLRALAARACVVVTDDFPCFFLPRMIAAAAHKVPTRLETVDSNGLLPLRAPGRAFSTAYAFRRFLQANLLAHLSRFPAANPLSRAELPHLRSLPAEITRRWARASPALLGGNPSALAKLPIDHSVGVVGTPGGTGAAEAAFREFVSERLEGYADFRNHPDDQATSSLSPYLHFGHISAHQVFHELVEREDWSPDDLAGRAAGKRSGWWGVGKAAEEFLDQLITWRELGFNMCAHRQDYDRYESLPDWARQTLGEHAADRRQYVYGLERFETARTHDPLWNAAQTQLAREGRLHNYLRMLWGKKILEWSATPQKAQQTMIELNNKYALDGRDPNSYSGIFWCLGRYDRPWGPERPVFGKVRYMSSESTLRKVRVREYLRKYAA